MTAWGVDSSGGSGPTPWGVAPSLLGRVGSALSPVGDLLQRGNKTVEAGIARGAGAGFNTLLHSDSQAEQDADRDAIRHRMRLHRGGALANLGGGAGGAYEDAPQWARGLADFGIDAALDPLTYVGGAGILSKLIGKAGGALTPRLIAAANANGGRTLVGKGFDLLAHNGPGVRAVYRGAGYGPETQDLLGDLRLLERKATNSTAKRADILDRALDTAFSKLTKPQWTQVFNAVDKGTEANLPAELKEAANTLKTVTHNQQYFQGTRRLRGALGAQFTPMQELLEEMGPRARGLLKKSRQNYIPYGRNSALPDIEEQIRAPISEQDLLRPDARLNVVAKGDALTDTLDPFTRARESEIRMVTDPEEQMRLLKARNRAFAKSTSASDLARELTQKFAPAKPIMRTVTPSVDTGEIYRDAVAGLSAADRKIVNKLMNGMDLAGISRRLVDRANTIKEAIETKQGRGLTESVPTKGTSRSFQDVPQHIRGYFGGQPYVPMAQRGTLEQLLNTPLAKVGGREIPSVNEGLQKLQRATNAVRFLLPFWHQGNVSSLAFNKDPGGALQGALRGLADPDINPLAHALRPMGWDSRNANDALIRGMQKAGVTSYIPEREVPDFIDKLKLGGLARASGKSLWKYDDLLRSLLTQRGVDAGETLGNSARDVNRAMVDYASNAPVANMAKSIVPFGKFRAGIPGAVASQLIRHPERFAMADRATRGEYTGGAATPPGSKRASKSYLPASEVLRLDPKAYMRSSLSPVVKDLLGALGLDYFTYGIKPNDKKHRFEKLLLSQTLGSVPGAQYGLSRLGLSPFDESTPLDSLLPVRLP